MKHVLVVEDEPDLRAIMAHVLTEEGYGVTTARDGPEALDCLHRCALDVVLLDWHLPGMDGEAVLRAYRRRFGADAPVVVVSAAPDAPEQARALGVRHVLLKPFHVADLLQHVAQLLRRQPTEATDLPPS
jgi:CheY-like chemotaxis protein